MKLQLQYVRAMLDSTRSDEGASAVEYGLLVAAIAAVIVFVVFALGGQHPRRVHRRPTTPSRAAAAVDLRPARQSNRRGEGITLTPPLS